MLKGKNLWGAAAAAMLVVSGLSIPSAQAGFIVTLVEQGTGVVATGSGTIDTTDLSLQQIAGFEPNIEADAAAISAGPAQATSGYLYTGSFSGLTVLGGSTGTIYANSGSGDIFGFIGFNGHLYLPNGYVSGSALSDTATYDNQTFASLDLTPGTYQWTWGSGADADSFTLQIGAAADVPEPTSLLLLTTGIFALGVVFQRKRTAPKFAV
jgi:hypothetical protein